MAAKKYLLYILFGLISFVGVSCSSPDRENRMEMLELGLNNTLSDMVDYYYSIDLWNAARIVTQIAELQDDQNVESSKRYIADQIETYTSYGKMAVHIVEQQQGHLSQPMLSDALIGAVNTLLGDLNNYFLAFSDTLDSNEMQPGEEFYDDNFDLAESLKQCNEALSTLGDREETYINDLYEISTLINEIITNLPIKG